MLENIRRVPLNRKQGVCPECNIRWIFPFKSGLGFAQVPCPECGRYLHKTSYHKFKGETRDLYISEKNIEQLRQYFDVSISIPINEQM